MTVSFNINEIGSGFSLDNIDLDPPKVMVRASGLEDRVMDGEWSLNNEDNQANFLEFCVNNTQLDFLFNLPMTLNSLDNYVIESCGDGGIAM